MPISALLRAMDPPVAARRARRRPTTLRYRAHITVALVVPEEFSFPDNWIYINDPNVKVGRIQNFGRWSPYLVKDGRTCLGLELFVDEGDEWWTKADDDLIDTGKRELEQIGLLDASQGRGGLRGAHAEGVPVLRRATTRRTSPRSRRGSTEHAPNVYPVGRNGMHRYNNQDHSMFTAMLSVENIFGANHDVWSVNVEAEYHEEVAAADEEPASTGVT